MTPRYTLLSAAAVLVPWSPLLAQQAATDTAAPPAAAGEPIDDQADDQQIVVTGQRAAGSVVGDIPPEDTLDSRDVRATGATTVNGLLEALAPQIGSARGRGAGAPVLLLNGQRISSFRELRDIPTEAIQRVEILPEEVALKYGYRADQKVVNIVLRRRFRSTVAQVGATAATEGGYLGGQGDLTRLMVQRNGRTTLNLHAEGNGMLTEAERAIAIPDATTAEVPAARSLIGTKRDVRGSATFNRMLFGDVSATLNAELEHQEGRSLIGLGKTLIEPLGRNTASDSAHAGLALNGNKAQWRWSLTGNADLDRDITRTDRDRAEFARDRARETRTSGDLTATANGNMFALPAGNASSTITLAATAVHLDAERTRLGQSSSSGLGRTTGEAGVNVDLPVSRRNRDFSALGNLTLNANAEVDQLSDFGTLTTIGAGVNWSPVDRVNLITSWTREDGPPTIQQLGDPLLETPGSRIFDFTRGESAQVTAITGGNPDLAPDRRNVVKWSGNWQPFANTDFRLRADYVHQRIARPIGSLNVSPAFEAAFPERFVRDAAGALVSVDLRPVNFDSSRRDTLRVGLDFSKPLKSRRPSQSVLDQMRAQFGFGRERPADAAAQGGPSPRDASAAGEARTERGSGGYAGRGFGGGGFGGGNRGRLQFSLTDTITFVDKVTIAPGLGLDYRHGDAVGSRGGTPHHEVQAQAGWSNNGVGARIGANWRSGTTVKSVNGDDLHFSPLGTVDLRLFANPGDVPELALSHPWLRGTQFRLEINNVLNSRPRVNDAARVVPFNYQPDLLDPLGRTITVSFRKLFLPSPSYFRQQREREQQQSR